jgi:NADH-quinone oxidoreductase subunit J
MPVGALVAAGLFFELFLVAGAATSANGVPISLAPNEPGQVTNAEQIGQVLYTDYLMIFQLAGLILFVAMIGAIVLTLRHRPGVKKQDIAAQVGRRRADGVELKDVRPGQGIG